MKSTHRIGLLLTLIFLLPVLFYSVYEMSSLDDDEKMIEEIYSKQLEAMLFSVNQYSDDVLGSWVSRIETSLANPVWGNDTPEKITDLMNLNSALKGVFFIDTTNNKPVLKTYSLEIPSGDSLWKEVMSSLEENPAVLQQLLSYKRSGFQKIERLNVASDERNLYKLVYITQTGWQFRVTGLVIDADLFIEDVVGPRLQTIARDQFILSALAEGRDSIVYTTQTENTQTQDEEQVQAPAEALTTEFWIFPDYQLGIRTRGNTLQELVQERTRNNFLLLIGLDLILVVAVILVYRNLKKEVNLAQNKSDFISNVSHEIRTPLALISMFSETLEMNRAPTEEKKQEYYRIISKETQRLTGIVNKILSFSQAEAKKKAFHMEKLNLNTEVKGVLDTYDFHLSNKGFEYTFAGQGELWVQADKQALIESVINLIDNAMKYSPDQKRIEISTGLSGHFAYIAVKDSGIGISKQDQKHIFDKFYRVSSGNLAKSRGTGLGLSLVKQLMEEQKGKITVTSEPGKGSTFTLYFPTEKKTD
jgi:two-component system, OmpR family, phosphate regulon sensor histidine kinase PhoR